jgi:hypothetical protein
LAYETPASRTFLSEQTSRRNQPTILFSQNKPAPGISHQPNEHAVYLWSFCVAVESTPAAVVTCHVVTSIDIFFDNFLRETTGLWNDTKWSINVGKKTPPAIIHDISRLELILPSLGSCAAGLHMQIVVESSRVVGLLGLTKAQLEQKIWKSQSGLCVPLKLRN